MSFFFFVLTFFQLVLQNEDLQGLYVVQKGQVIINFVLEAVRDRNATSLLSESLSEENIAVSSKESTVKKTEGSYFGEWTLVGESIESLSATAVGNVTCAVLTKEKFESVVGPLVKLPQDDYYKYDVVYCILYFLV